MEASLAQAIFLPVTQKIDAALQNSPHTLVAIDGMSGAGKSTLASLLCQKYNCGLVHTDDFFLQNQQRTPARLAEIGGNIDYERLALCVAKAKQGKPFFYTPFNCQSGSFGPNVKVPGGKLTIVEGVYALHPSLSSFYTLKFFLQLNPETQRRRILKRSGQQLATRFFNEWVPMENLYFKHFNIKASCNNILAG